MSLVDDSMPTLFDVGLIPTVVPIAAHDSIDANFEAFHTANPWVYDALVTLARDMVQRDGHRTVGMKMLFEVLRWQYTRQTVDPASEFKLNNNYTSRYARHIMENEPDLDGVFETRHLVAS